MFQESEIVTLILGLIAICIIPLRFTGKKIPASSWLFGGLAMIFAAQCFTVIEGVLWKEFFNTLEHLSYLFSGLAFVIGCRKMSRYPAAMDKNNSA